MAKTLKKAVIVLLCLLTVISVLAALPITADAAVSKSGTTLTLSGAVTLAELTKYSSKSSIKTITAKSGTTFSGTDATDMFKGFSACTSIDLSNVNFQKAFDATRMFAGLSKLTTVKLSSKNKPSLKSAKSMFENCTALQSIDLSNLNTSSCQDMSNMFAGCTKLGSINFGTGFSTAKVTSMNNMFRGCTALTSLDLSRFYTSMCLSMPYMFAECSNLKTITLGTYFTTRNVSNFNAMFDGCSALEAIDVSGFDTSGATSMLNMFRGCSLLTELDLKGFKTSNVEYIWGIFSGCSGLTSLNLSGFDTSGATMAKEMFKDCSSLTELDLSSFVEDESAIDKNRYADLFIGCTALDKVKLSDRFSIREEMKLTNAKDDYMGWVNEEDADAIVSGDGEYAAFSGAGTYVRATVSPVDDKYFVKHSLSLNGDVAVNFYLKFTAEEVQTAAVSFKWFNKELNDVPAVLDPKGSGYYKVTCPVAVAEMTYDITATLTIGGEEKETDIYSVKRYADVILSDEYRADYEESGRTDYNELSALVKAMLDYGTKAQAHFVRDIENPANGGADYYTDPVTADMILPQLSDMDAGLDAYGLEYAGTSIVYLSATTLRHYYRITDAAKFADVQDQVTFDNESVSYGENGSFIYFDKQDIAAPRLDTAYRLSFGGADYGYAVTDYLKKVLANDSQPQSLRELAAATYRYNQAANTYFGE